VVLADPPRDGLVDVTSTCASAGAAVAAKAATVAVVAISERRISG
jgi:hypothetical protein